MTKLEVTNKKGLWKDANISARVLDDAELPKAVVKHRKYHEYGVTKKEFFAILDKASQPIKHDAKSDSKKSET
jgi:hypothetical protein